MEGPTLGWQLVDFIETLLVHGPGDVRGAPIELPDPWARFIACCYELDHRNGRRIWQEAAAIYPKGTAKSSLLAAPLTICEALGPVRFDHWAARGETSWWGYRYAKGEPVGRPVTSPEVLVLATSETQADGTTYEAVYDMLQMSPLRDHFPQLDIGLTRTILPGAGEIKIATSKAISADGARTTFAVVDESHLWFAPELWRLFSVVQRNIVKRAGGADPWLLQTSTCWAAGEESVAEASAQAVEAAIARNAPPPLLWHRREAPEPRDWSSPTDVAQALRTAYSGFPWLVTDEAIAGKVKLIADGRSRREDSARYFLGIAMAAGTQWVPAKVVEAAIRDVPALQEGDALALGFDGSRTDDSTALFAVRLDDLTVHQLGLWERPLGPEGHAWEVDAADVDATFRAAMEAYDVRLAYFDPPFWRDLLLAYQAEWPDVVLAYETNNERRMSEAIELAETALRSGRVTLAAPSTTLRRHIGNARAVRRPNGTIKIGKRRHAAKIDAAVAFLLAWRAAVTLLYAPLDDEVAELEPCFAFGQ